MIFSNKKEFFLTYLLFSYIGGVSFYIGISTTLHLIPSICALISFFIGHYVLEYTITSKRIHYRFKHNLVSTFCCIIVSLIISSTIIGVSNFFYESKYVSFLIEPFTFGLIYGAFYLLLIINIYTVNKKVSFGRIKC